VFSGCYEDLLDSRLREWQFDIRSSADPRSAELEIWFARLRHKDEPPLTLFTKGRMFDLSQHRPDLPHDLIVGLDPRVCALTMPNVVQRLRDKALRFLQPVEDARKLGAFRDCRYDDIPQHVQVEANGIALVTTIGSPLT